MAMFSSDPAVAKQQMLAIVFLLTAFGHMDGKFALSEKRFVQEKIAKLVEERMLEAVADLIPERRKKMMGEFGIAKEFATGEELIENEDVSAVRALDRTLMSGFYAIPLFNVQEQWIARWNRIERPEATALTGYLPETWWQRPVP